MWKCVLHEWNLWYNALEPSTVRQPGTTHRALLWALWHQNKFTCGSFRDASALRAAHPQALFVIIQVGTHAESHNENYMRLILDQLLQPCCAHPVHQSR